VGKTGFDGDLIQLFEGVEGVEVEDVESVNFG